MRKNPLDVINKLINERYKDAKAVFWAGSVSKGQGNETSDLDLMIFYEKLPNASREAFIYDGWPIDTFINDIDTLRYFLEESQHGNGISGSIHMILNGLELTTPTDFSNSIKSLAQEIFALGPISWDKTQIDKERFLITDMLDNIKCPVSREEQIASASWLYEALSQFYFRSQNKWRASGKSIIRYLNQDNPDLAKEFTNSFKILFETGDSNALDKLVRKILTPFGGLLWDGFKLESPKEWRLEK